MNIAYKRVNKDSGNYNVLLDGKNVGSIVGKAKNWELKNLFGSNISKGITRDNAVKNAIENLWEYELEFDLFHDSENNQEKKEEATPEVNQEENLEEEVFVDTSEDTEKENASFLNLNENDEVGETAKITEENNLLDSRQKLGDDYQPMEKESIFSKCARIFKNFLVKKKE